MITPAVVVKVVTLCVLGAVFFALAPLLAAAMILAVGLCQAINNEESAMTSKKIGCGVLIADHGFTCGQPAAYQGRMIMPMCNQCAEQVERAGVARHDSSLCMCPTCGMEKIIRQHQLTPAATSSLALDALKRVYPDFSPEEALLQARDAAETAMGGIMARITGQQQDSHGQ